MDSLGSVCVGVKHSGNIAGLPHGLGSLGHFPPGPLSFPAGSALAGEGGQAAGRTWRPRYAGGRGRARRGRGWGPAPGGQAVRVSSGSTAPGSVDAQGLASPGKLGVDGGNSGQAGSGWPRGSRDIRSPLLLPTPLVQARGEGQEEGFGQGDLSKASQSTSVLFATARPCPLPAVLGRNVPRWKKRPDVGGA